MEEPLRAAGGARVRKEGADGLSGLGASFWKTSPWRPMRGRAVAAITTLPQHRATSPCLSFPISLIRAVVTMLWVAGPCQLLYVNS